MCDEDFQKKIELLDSNLNTLEKSFSIFNDSIAKEIDDILGRIKNLPEFEMFDDENQEYPINISDEYFEDDISTFQYKDNYLQPLKKIELTPLTTLSISNLEDDELSVNLFNEEDCDGDIKKECIKTSESEEFYSRNQLLKHNNSLKNDLDFRNSTTNTYLMDTNSNNKHETKFNNKLESSLSLEEKNSFTEDGTDKKINKLSETINNKSYLSLDEETEDYQVTLTLQEDLKNTDKKTYYDSDSSDYYNDEDDDEKIEGLSYNDKTELIEFNSVEPEPTNYCYDSFIDCNKNTLVIIEEDTQNTTHLPPSLDASTLIPNTNQDLTNGLVYNNAVTYRSKNRKFILPEDYEPIVTLSNNGDVQNNKKIQFIKHMINNLIVQHFTTQESLIIHSIYNFNRDCLLKRNKLFKEYTLILIILNVFSIKFTNYLTLVLFPQIPCLNSSKKIKKINNEILLNYVFKDFAHKNNGRDLDKVVTSIDKIEMYIKGFVFYFKNQLLIKAHAETIIEYSISVSNHSDLNEEMISSFTKQYFGIEDTDFCMNKQFQLIIDWFNLKVKNLIVYNLKENLNQSGLYLVNNKKPIDYQIHCFMYIIFKMIILIHEFNLTSHSSFKIEVTEIKKITKFLYFEFANTPIQKMIHEPVFYILLRYCLEKKFKKISLSTKKYIHNLLDKL